MGVGVAGRGTRRAEAGHPAPLQALCSSPKPPTTAPAAPAPPMVTPRAAGVGRCQDLALGASVRWQAQPCSVWGALPLRVGVPFCIRGNGGSEWLGGSLGTSP